MRGGVRPYTRLFSGVLPPRLSRYVVSYIRIMNRTKVKMEKMMDNPGFLKNDQQRFRVRVLFRRLAPILISIMILTWMVLKPWVSALAGPSLTIEMITWNVVGLSSDPASGPNVFPVGARVCNKAPADQPATGIIVNLEWEPGTDDTYIHKVSGTTSYGLASLGIGECADFYFRIVVERNTTIPTTRKFTITASANGLPTITTPPGREIYVTTLNPLDFLEITSITGPTQVYINQIYTYVVRGTLSSSNYQQLEYFINYTNNKMRILSVAASYQFPTGSTNNSVYEDACGWVSDPYTTTYRTCSYPTVSISGTLVTTYTVQILATGAITLTGTLYGYSNSGYYYNADNGVDKLHINAGGATPTATDRKSVV